MGREGESEGASKEASIMHGNKYGSSKTGCENEQTDSLDGRTQVEDKLRQERAVSSSEPQTQGLGKRR